MGFLTEGSTFVWGEASQRPIDLVREHGVAQLLHTWRRHAAAHHAELKWGEEVEYLIVHERKVGHTLPGLQPAPRGGSSSSGGGGDLIQDGASASAASAASSASASSSSSSTMASVVGASAAAVGGGILLPPSRNLTQQELDGHVMAKGDVRLCLRGHEILDELEATEQSRIANRSMPRMLWRPEYGSYMIEGTPGTPYGSGGKCEGMSSIACVEPDLRRRRRMIQERLRPGERAITLVNFPLLGALDPNGYCFTEPPTRPGGPTAVSLFTSDEMIHPHFRFHTLTKNIRARRTEKVGLCLPLFVDENTPASRHPLPLPLPATTGAARAQESAQRSQRMDKQADPDNTLTMEDPASIYLDSMAFGMGMNCLQITFQCRDVDEARFFYDQMAVLSPVLLALSGNSPIYRGYLSDIDCRWKVIAASVDDRSPFERARPGAVPPSHSTVTQSSVSADGSVVDAGRARLFRQAKSRYESASLYINREGSGYDTHYKDAYNDVEVSVDVEVEEILQANPVANLDPRIARHFAHYFSRDPLVIYRDKLTMDDTERTDHFENVQSTNWQTVRFKPPPAGTDHDIGWRVEFRPLDIQMSDFENAAFAFLVVSLTRVLLLKGDKGVNLYMLLSKVDENMEIAHRRDAVRTEKFWWRKDIRKESGFAPDAAPEDEIALFSLNDILNGRGDGPQDKGLLDYVREYLEELGDKVSQRAQDKAKVYLEFLSKRASGELVTGATWIRNFVRGHPDYQKDSVISSTIARDLCIAADEIGSGVRHEPTLLGSHRVQPLWEPAGDESMGLSSGMDDRMAQRSPSLDRGKLERDLRAGLHIHPALNPPQDWDASDDGKFNMRESVDE